LDYRRIIPLLANWSDEMVVNTECFLSVIFSQMVNLERLATAQALIAASVGDDINLMQHCGFCRAKVQHVLQADRNDPAHSMKTVTDKAYGQTRHFCPCSFHWSCYY
jgi:hypothetical protein